MIDLIIESSSGKGRSFQATMIASMTAPRLWEQGQAGNDERPVWAVLAGTDASLRAFVANLRLGKKAEQHTNSYRRSTDRFEFLRSVKYRQLWSRQTEGTVVTIYHPDLFNMDPGMVDPQGVRFVCAPPTSWAADQNIDATPIIQHLRILGSKLTDEEIVPLLPLAYLWAVYLDRRTRFPIIADGRFYVQLFLAALDVGLAMYPDYRKFTVRGLTEAGIVDRPVAFHASHDQVGDMLTTETTRYFTTVGNQ